MALQTAAACHLPSTKDGSGQEAIAEEASAATTTEGSSTDSKGAKKNTSSCILNQQLVQVGRHLSALPQTDGS